jgi:hypothetical protein
MSYKGKYVEYKAIGWTGYSDGTPFYEDTYDDYSGLLPSDKGTPILNVFKIKKEARKRFQDIRRVFVEVK